MIVGILFKTPPRVCYGVISQNTPLRSCFGVSPLPKWVHFERVGFTEHLQWTFALDGFMNLSLVYSIWMGGFVKLSQGFFVFGWFYKASS